MAEPKVCEACGASIHAEHLDSGRAGRWAGQLLCTVCYAEKRAAIEGVGEPSAAPSVDLVGRDEPERLPLPDVGIGESSSAPEEDEPISLVDVDEDDDQPMVSRKIRRISQRAAGQTERKDWKRKTAASGQGACRVRTFHSKIQVESLEFMDNAINEWLDEHPEVEVKFVTSTIGIMAGKHPEPNVILNIWY